MGKKYKNLTLTKDDVQYIKDTIVNPMCTDILKYSMNEDLIMLMFVKDQLVKNHLTTDEQFKQDYYDYRSKINESIKTTAETDTKSE